jgi:hypothetical protein
MRECYYRFFENCLKKYDVQCPPIEEYEQKLDAFGRDNIFIKHHFNFKAWDEFIKEVIDEQNSKT